MEDQNSQINPQCAGCNSLIGGMPLDIYLKAVNRRGEYLFCPACRLHKCDCCGWVIPSEEMRKVYSPSGRFIGNACAACFDWVISDTPTEDDFPNFRTMERPSFKTYLSNLVSGVGRVKGR